MADVFAMGCKGWAYSGGSDSGPVTRACVNLGNYPARVDPDTACCSKQ